LWKAYLDAKEQMEIVYSASSSFYHLEDEGTPFLPAVPERLRSLLARGNELFREYEQFKTEAEQAAQDAAWAYVSHVADLNRGDQIEADGYRGRETFHCWHAWADEPDPRDFQIHGPVARKDGSPGKRSSGMTKLFSDDWTLVGRAREAWPPQSV
jgi:hypothetical protein